jgi:hypothetical protein
MKNTRSLARWLSLALMLAFVPVQGAVAASPAVQDEATAEDSHWLAAVSASKLAGNGTSLSGRKLNGAGGMTVVSMELPGGARHAK